MRRPVVAVAALSIGAALAGPASAGGDSGPSGRTGNLHQDCDRFDTLFERGGIRLRAWCRISDDNNDRKQTGADLGANVGNDKGYLKWGQSLFHKSCDYIDVASHSGGVTLSAVCAYQRCTSSPNVRCTDRSRATKLELGSYLGVNSSGDIEVK